MGEKITNDNTSVKMGCFIQLFDQAIPLGNN